MVPRSSHAYPLEPATKPRLLWAFGEDVSGLMPVGGWFLVTHRTPYSVVGKQGGDLTSLRSLDVGRGRGPGIDVGRVYRRYGVCYEESALCVGTPFPCGMITDLGSG